MDSHAQELSRIISSLRGGAEPSAPSQPSMPPAGDLAAPPAPQVKVSTSNGSSGRWRTIILVVFILAILGLVIYYFVRKNSKSSEDGTILKSHTRSDMTAPNAPSDVTPLEQLTFVGE